MFYTVIKRVHMFYTVINKFGSSIKYWKVVGYVIRL